MSRPRLSPEEKAAKRKARNAFTFSDAAYQHYNPEVEGYGNADEWESTARRMFGLAKLRKAGPHNKWLDLLGLDAMPATLDLLKKAFRQAAFRTHPDHGGTNQAFREVLEAFATLEHNFQ